MNFIVGVWSLNEEEIKKNLEYVKVPSVNIETIRSKPDMKIFDEYASLLSLNLSHPDNLIINNFYFMFITFIDDPFERITVIPLSNHHHSYKEH